MVKPITTLGVMIFYSELEFFFYIFLYQAVSRAWDGGF